MTDENKIKLGGLATILGTIATSVLLSVGLSRPAEVKPQEDGIARVMSNGQWFLAGHNHGDRTFHLGCTGCGDSILPLIDARVEAQVNKLGPAIAQYMDQKMASVAAVESK